MLGVRARSREALSPWYINQRQLIHWTASPRPWRFAWGWLAADNDLQLVGSDPVDAGDHDIGAIGRGPELGSIARFLADLPTGPSALVIEGEAGIGKTTLWNEGAATATRASFTMLSARPALAEAELPYLSLGDLLTEVPDQLLAELPVPQRKALDAALLRTEEEEPLQQRAVSVAVLNVLLLLARSAPVLVAIDDVQWLDPPTSRVLRFAIRRLSPTPIGIMVAIRTGSTDEDPLDLGSALPAERVHRLPVGPLGTQALEHLLRTRLHATFSGPTLRRLEQTSGGNPFFALELGRVLDQDVSASLGQPLPIPGTLTDLLSARLQRLPMTANRALLVASALSRPTVDLVCAASADAETTSAGLDRAAEAGLITLRDGSVRFVHPLFASVVYSQASAAELRRLHKRLAAVVTDAEDRARHLGLAARGPDESVAQAMDAAARRAAVRGAQDAAASFMEQAARLTPPDAAHDLTRRKVDAADHHVAAGETARARVLLEEVVATSDAGGTQARALHRLSKVRALEGGFGAAPPLLRQAAEEVGDDLALRTAIERDTLFSLIQVGALSEALPHARAGLQAAEALGEPILLAEALDHLCMAESLVGNGVDPDLLARAIALDEQVGPAPLLEHPGWATGRFPLALTLKWMDRFAAARDLLRSLYAEHTGHGDEGSLAPVLFHLCELECWAGNWGTAADLAAESHGLASRTGQAMAAFRALILEALVEASRGNVETARSKGREGLALSEPAHDVLSVIRVLKVLGFIELSVGDPRRAVDYLERGMELEAGAGYDPGVVRLLPDAIEAFVAVGRLGDATHLVDGLEARGRMLDRPWALATGARCRGLLEAATGDLAKAEASLERSLAEHERLPQPFELARTLLAMGVVLRRSKQKRRARECLGRALAIFEELGARLWVERARVELGRIGGRPSSPIELTPTEEGIAGLVAEGYTNREVAESMFLSVKTVESNLTRVYRKLGVSSRRELARRMRPG